LQLTGAPSVAVERLLISSHDQLQSAYCADRPQLNSGVSLHHTIDAA